MTTPVDPRDPEVNLAAEFGDPVAVEEAREGAFAAVGRGVRWSAISAMVMRLGQFLIGIVAARIIDPGQFGAFAVALTVYGIVLTLSDLGVSQAIVRFVDRTREIGPTVMTLNTLSTIVIGGLMALLARPVSVWLHAPGATGAIRVLALTMFMGSLGTVPAMVLARDFRQRERFMSDFSNFVASSVLLFVLAEMGHGAMALAWSRFIGQAVSAVVLNLVCTERYRWGWDRRVAGELLRFSIPLAGAMALTVAIWNVDTVTVSRVRGSDALGYYNLAYNVAQWPIGVFSQVLLNISLATFARSQDDLPMLENHLRAFMISLAAVVLPVSAMLTALANPLIRDVYGHKWLPAVEPLMVLGLFTAVRLVQVLFTDLFTALGRTRTLFWLQVIWFVTLVPVMIVFVHLWGTVGAAITHVAVGLVVVVPAYLVAMVRGCKLGLGWAGVELVRPALGAIAAGAASYAVVQWLHNPVITLFLGGIVGLVVYLLITGTWLRRHVRTLRATYGRGGAQPESA